MGVGEVNWFGSSFKSGRTNPFVERQGDLYVGVCSVDVV